VAPSIIYVREIPEFKLDGLPLGRHVEHDDRSRQYAFQVPEHLVSGQLQPVRHQRFVPVLDQGNLGSCCGNAAEGVAGTGSVFQAIPPTVAGRPSPTDAVGDEAQAVALYAAATLLDNVPGSYPPDDTGSTGVAAAKAAVKAGLIAGYQHTFSLADALAALQLVPLMFGINWYDSFDQVGPDGLVTITPGAQVRGGHEIVADELDVTRRVVGFTNSWSASWGLGGRFYIGWGDVEQLLGEQGDVTVPVPLSQQPPQPAPTPAPGPDQVDAAMWSAAQTWAKARGLT
jgi:hypothetical protein